MSHEASLRPGKMILVPAVITLAVTLLRLIGELQGWSSTFFNREAGGGGAVIGIAWLVPVFGAWFGWRLARAGSGPGPLGRAIGLVLAALVLVPLLGFVVGKLGVDPNSFTTFGVFVVGALVRWRWPFVPGPPSAARSSPTAWRLASRWCW